MTCEVNVININRYFILCAYGIFEVVKKLLEQKYKYEIFYYKSHKISKSKRDKEQDLLFSLSITKIIWVLSKLQLQFIYKTILISTLSYLKIIL